MRIGSCLLMLATAEDPLAKASIPLVKSAGYDYAEVPLARLWPLDRKEIEAYHGLFVRHGLPVECFNNSIPDGLRVVGPGADPEVLEAFIRWAVETAALMGVSVITMCGPLRDTVPPDFGWEEGFGQYVEFLKRYAGAAAKAGIVLALEPINGEENGFISTVGEALRVVRACGMDNVKIIVDLYHFFKQGDDWGQLLDICRDQVVHVHYGTRTERTYPLERDAGACGEELLPLLEAGYRGRISVEAHTARPEKDLPETCALLRRLLA